MKLHANKSIHKSKGNTSGLGITAYFSMLFEINEICPKKRKLTDLEIAIKLAKEFPTRKTAQLVHFVGPNKKHTINSYRYRYNSGKFTRGVLPKRRSFRYNDQGEVVDSKTGKHLLSEEEIIE